MKHFILFYPALLAWAFLFLQPRSARASDLLSAGRIGNLQYFAFADQNSIEIIPPWKIRVDFTDLGAAAGPDRYFANLYAELNSSLDSPDTLALLQKFPGYRIAGLTPHRLSGIHVDLGDGHPVTLQAPPSSQNFFTGLWKIDSKKGPTVWKNLKAGQLPEIRIEAGAEVPTLVPTEKFTLPLDQICPTGMKETSVGALLAVLVRRLQPIYQILQTTEMKDLVLETTLDHCLRSVDAAPIETLSDVLKLKVNLAPTVEAVDLQAERLDRVRKLVLVPSEIVIEEHQ